MSLKTIIEKNDTKFGRIFDLFIQFLILISLVSFSIETLPDLSTETSDFLWIIEVVCVIIFTFEYFLRIFVANKKLKFIFSFYGLIDLIAILPFYIASGIDLRAIRIFRILRIFRAFKIFRYSKAINRFKNAFSAIKEELIVFFFATIFLLYVSSVGVMLPAFVEGVKFGCRICCRR